MNSIVPTDTPTQDEAPRVRSLCPIYQVPVRTSDVINQDDWLTGNFQCPRGHAYSVSWGATF